MLRKYAEEIQRLNEVLEWRVEERTRQLQDILQQLEASRRELAEALSKERELSDLKSRFLTMASHEFRTPLSTILSSALLIERYTQSHQQAQRQRHVQRIRANVQHLIDMLEDFLSVEQLHHGTLLTHVTTFDLPSLVEKIIDDFSATSETKRTVRFSHQGPAQVVGDARLYEHILINVISNAFKFTQPAGTIAITTTVDEKSCTIQVADDGLGIETDDLPYVGKRFFRGRNHTHIKGIGLGLHLVRNYLHMMGGHLSFTSQVGQGSVFTITIPFPNTYENNTAD